MQKAAGYVCVILKGILFIGISIQTILGIVWMCCNFANIPSFGDSLFYFQVSETLKCDEYTGILYPLILRLTGAHQSIVYLLQLAAACGAADRFLRSFGRMKKGWRIWGCLGLLTMPVVMQCHMALLPCSFVSSLMLLALTWLIGEAFPETSGDGLFVLACGSAAFTGISFPGSGSRIIVLALFSFPVESGGARGSLRPAAYGGVSGDDPGNQQFNAAGGIIWERGQNAIKDPGPEDLLDKPVGGLRGLAVADDLVCQ